MKPALNAHLRLFSIGVVGVLGTDILTEAGLGPVASRAHTQP
jgi:hypothetical protein